MRDELLSKRAGEIRGMFGRIAHRYDLLNRLLSLGQDLRWRRLVAERVAAVDPRLVLDVCTGTGDLALGYRPAECIAGCDFCLPMLARARAKADGTATDPCWFAADALRLPLADSSVDVVSVAFGIRNFEDLASGLGELARVLRPGGRALVLEFATPRGALGPLLRWWVRWVPPLVGRVVSGDDEAYRYLTLSVESFPEPAQIRAVMERVGFGEVGVTSLTGGVAVLYEARRGTMVA
jgi:demethylmenaquinone methyltransferase/2-methoxy-6-polyprenyl-1,4-benzoquinol methylase